MPRKHVFRENDRIRLLTGRVVVRVGYPLTLRDAVEQMPNLWDAVAVACEHAGIRPPIRDTLLRDQPDILKSRSPYAKVARELAHLWLQQQKFGGPERSLHCQERPALVGRECVVYGKRVAYTGTRYSGGGGYSWTDLGREYDYEPPGLANRKAHVLLDIGIAASTHQHGRIDRVGWVLAADVEPVT